VDSLGQRSSEHQKARNILGEKLCTIYDTIKKKKSENKKIAMMRKWPYIALQ